MKSYINFLSVSNVVLYSLMAMLFFTGCAGMSPFSKATIEDNLLDSKELHYIQYYIDSPLTLEYKRSEASSIVDDKKVKHELTLYEKDIILEKNTPGIFEEIDESNGIIQIKFAEDIILGFELATRYERSSYLKMFNGDFIEESSKVDFRGETWVAKYGARSSSDNHLNTSGKFTPGGIPKLVYKYSSKMQQKYEAELIKGMKVN